MIAQATQANIPPRSPRSEPRLSAEEDIDGKTEGRGNKVAPELTRAVTTDVLLQLAVKSSSGNQKKGKFDDVDSLECLDIYREPPSLTYQYGCIDLQVSSGQASCFYLYAPSRDSFVWCLHLA